MAVSAKQSHKGFVRDKYLFNLPFVTSIMFISIHASVVGLIG